MMIATCFGTWSAGMSGGVAPDGCGSGARTAARATPLLEPLLNLGTAHPSPTYGKDRRPRSRCQATYADTRPRPSRRCRSSAASTTVQSPASSAPRRSRVSLAGLADPGTLQPGHSDPPAAGLNARCGPSSPQLAQAENDGA